MFFAYGMTNAGKTHTIQGDKDTPGCLPRLVTSVLERMRDETDWDLTTGMMEIYQEKIFDLLGKNKSKLHVRDGNGRVEVTGLSAHPIGSADQAVDYLNEAAKRRSKSNTFLNTGSSRSHAIYSLSLKRMIEGRETTAVFQVVDLAGAERGKRTMGTNLQRNEANYINKSLMMLWRCLQAMHNKVANIPFRESKLTHLLMPLLGRVGLAGIGMITCVNPQINDYDETISILGNASLACRIQEISDMGRSTTVGVVGVQSNNPLDNIRAHKRAHSSSRDTSSTSTATTSGRYQRPYGKRGTASINSERHRSESNSSRDSGDIDKILGESVVASELKRLREEVQQLRDFNSSLLESQVHTEQSIREEVADEMAQHSAVLLNQIRSLQEQVNDTQDSYHYDVTKSVKKAKKQHLDLRVAEDAQDAVAEMEEELERMKCEYEAEVEILTRQKNELVDALEMHQKATAEAQSQVAVLESKLQSQQERINQLESAAAMNIDTEEEAEAVPPPSTVFQAIEINAGKISDASDNAPIESELAQASDRISDVKVVIPPMRLSRSSKSSIRISGPAEEVQQTIEPVRISAAAELNKRLKRDQRFKHSDATEAPSAEVAEDNKTPGRKALAPADPNSHSPKRQAGAETGDKETTTAKKKRAISPTRFSPRKVPNNNENSAPMVRQTAKTRARDAAIKSPRKAEMASKESVSETFQARRLRSRMRA